MVNGRPSSVNKSINTPTIFAARGLHRRVSKIFPWRFRLAATSSIPTSETLRQSCRTIPLLQINMMLWVCSRTRSAAALYPVSYTYDAQGRMKTMKTYKNLAANSGVATTTWNYDAYRGWLSSKVYDDSHGPSYDYTPAGRLRTRTWARGV